MVALSSGIFITWPSPSIPILLSKEYSVTISMEEANVLIILPSIAIVLSSPVAGKLIDSIGRKKTLMLIAAMQFITWLLIAFGNSKATFFLARILNGIEDSCAFAALPSYISEVATPKIRGTWGNTIAFLVYFGNFIMNVVGTYCSIPVTSMIFAVIPLVFLVVFAFFPESPYYLLITGRDNEARTALSLLRSGDIDGELMQLKADIDRQLSESGGYKDLFTIPSNRRAVLVGAFVRGAQQFSGITVFLMYAQLIFQESAGEVSASMCAIIFSAFMVFTNLISSCLIDIIGRRLSMFISSLGCAVFLAIQAVYYYLKSYSDIDVENLRLVPLICMVVFIIFYSLGLGVVPTLMLGELFSSRIKGKALCLMNLSFGVYIASSSGLFSLFMVNYGLSAAFGFFALCCFTTSLLSYMLVPETRGKTLEEIQQLFRTQTKI